MWPTCSFTFLTQLQWVYPNYASCTSLLWHTVWKAVVPNKTLLPPTYGMLVTFSHTILTWHYFLIELQVWGTCNWITVISLIYTPLFLTWSVRGKQQWQNYPSLSCTACDELVVAQLCRAKDLESMKPQRVCVPSENVSFCITTSRLSTSLSLRSQSLGWCITGQ